MTFKTYLGDGVYAEIDRSMIKLTTEDGYSVTNTIYLEVEVFEKLLEFEKKVSETLKEGL